MKILVVKRDKLGDLLLTTPLLVHLRASLPDAQIHLLSSDYNAWVVAEEPTIDRRWVRPRVRIGHRVSLPAALGVLRTRWRLPREHFDVAIAANGSPSPRATDLAIASRAQRVIAYVGSGKPAHGVTDPLPVRDDLHEADRLLAMLQPLHIAMPVAPIHPRFRLPASRDAEARAWLAERGVEPDRYVVIGLGARRPKKQPSAQQVLSLAEWLHREHGLSVVFMWTPGAGDNPHYPGDDAVAQPVLDARPPTLHPFRGPILPALGLIWNARASLFPDSGLMHFAAASPGGVVGLFAEIEISPPPSQWGPRGPRASHLVAERSVTELAEDTLRDALGPIVSVSPRSTDRDSSPGRCTS